jgi:hypothetical protein
VPNGVKKYSTRAGFSGYDTFSTTPLRTNLTSLSFSTFVVSPRIDRTNCPGRLTPVRICASTWSVHLQRRMSSTTAATAGVVVGLLLCFVATGLRTSPRRRSSRGSFDPDHAPSLSHAVDVRVATMPMTSLVSFSIVLDEPEAA